MSEILNAKRKISSVDLSPIFRAEFLTTHPLLVPDHLGNPLTIEDVICLRENVFLNDLVMNNAMRLLLLAYQRSSGSVSGESVAVLSSFFYERIIAHLEAPRSSQELDKLAKWEKLKYPEGVLNFSTIFAVVHLPSHWILVRIEVEERKFTVYDSCVPKGITESHKEVVINFCSYFKKSLNENVKEIVDKPWETENAGCPKQSGVKSGLGSDCGIFVMMCFSRLLENRSLDFTQEYIRTNKIREKVFLNLYNCDFSIRKL